MNLSSSVPWKQDWPDALQSETVMFIGKTGTGKTHRIVDELRKRARRGEKVALVTADMGQPVVGVPGCLGAVCTQECHPVSYEEFFGQGLFPTEDFLDKLNAGRPDALWFIGDVVPTGHLLQTVVGTSRLVHWARDQGAQIIFIDTTGLVEGSAARILKYHQVMASGVSHIVAVQREDELEELLNLLQHVCPQITTVSAAPEARNRTAAERKKFRENRYRQHFQTARRLEFPREKLIDSDWSPLPSGKAAHSLRGTAVGLIGSKGFCLGLGIVESFERDNILIDSPCSTPNSVVQLLSGKIRLDRRTDFTEVR